MLRPWELNVEIDRQSGIAIHVQIAHKIIIDIQSGRFTGGVALPGTRDLARKINVNRKTVIQAYDELVAQGWLTSEHKRGTFVSNNLPARTLSINHQHLQPTHFQHKNTLPTHSQADSITPFQSKKQKQGMIHFSEGLSDARLIPFEVLSRAMRHALNITARHNKSSYGDAKGALILREAILQMLNMERGLHAQVDNICITRGSQMGVFLTARAIVKTGDYVVFEHLSNPLAREAFASCGANILTVAHDYEGIDINQLAELCLQFKIRAVYVTPQHQMPTTATMSQTRRRQLLALATQYDFYIVEDDSDYEFNFNHQSTLPLASLGQSNKLDHGNHVIYIGSLSKVLAPSFRIGYVVAPKKLIDLYALQVAMIDRQGDQITELAVAELLHIGEIKKHLLRTSKIYEERYTLICKLIREELSEFVSFNRPGRGLALWLEISPKINMHILVRDAELWNVSLTTGASFSHANHQVQGIRLGFANLNQDEIRIGVSRLKLAFLNQQLKLKRA